MPSDPEGITALFSMYNDDDDEEEAEADGPKPPSPEPPTIAGVSSPPLSQAGGQGPNPSQAPPSPPLTEDSAGRKTLASLHPSPALPPLPSRRPYSPLAVSSPSRLRPSSKAPPADLPRPPRRGALAIVDYAHDEMAMSPEQEDGEIMSRADRFGSEAQAAEANLEEQILSGAIHTMSQNSQAEISQQHTAPELIRIGLDTAMKQKINKFLAYQRAGKSFNAEVRNRKEYRNPDFLQHAVRYQDIDQIGTCFSKDVFDPYGYDKSDYYNEIEADMKRELERKEQERKTSPKVEFIAGVQQTPIGASIPKIPGGMTGNPVPTEGVQKETRPNKKSKWDKVDGDINNPAVPSGYDNLSAAVSAALLVSANVGAGYAAFAPLLRQLRTSFCYKLMITESSSDDLITKIRQHKRRG